MRRPTDEELDWLQATIRAGIPKYKEPGSLTWKLPTGRDLRPAFRARFGRRASGRWIDQVVRENFAGRASENAPRNMQTWATIRFIKEHWETMPPQEVTRRLNERFGTDFRMRTLQYWITKYNQRKNPEQKIRPFDYCRFTTGTAPPNRVPVGTVRDRKSKTRSGYERFVKTAETSPWTGLPLWKPLAIFNWEQEHGPVPKGSNVILVDGDHTHCEIDNLECVTNAELARLNQGNWQDLPLEMRRTAILAARVKTRAFVEAPSRSTLYKLKKEQQQ